MIVSAKPVLWGEVDEAGRLVIPPELAAQYGLKPGAKVLFEREEYGVRLHQSVNHLAKLYLSHPGCAIWIASPVCGMCGVPLMK
jgi:bifunctional DNA-binding transcriptional regulator/antitoxin component of YhaV-PrlF toxin-antitoxin module